MAPIGGPGPLLMALRIVDSDRSPPTGRPATGERGPGPVGYWSPMAYI